MGSRDELLLLPTCSAWRSVGNKPGVCPDALMNDCHCVTPEPEGTSEVTRPPDGHFTEEEMGEAAVSFLCVRGIKSRAWVGEWHDIEKIRLPNVGFLLHPVPRRTAPPACAPGPSLLGQEVRQTLGAHAAQP